jgi:hypothetical protein
MSMIVPCWLPALPTGRFLTISGMRLRRLSLFCGIEGERSSVTSKRSAVSSSRQFFNTATVALWPGFPWQRVNLANLQEGWQWSAWRRATTLDPDDFNTNAHGLLQAYSRRRLLTTISNSDDLAQELDPDHPNLRNPALPDHDMGIYRGQLKFYA